GPNGTLIGGWKTAPSLSSARAGAAAVVANGYIYVLGGTPSTKANSTATVFYASGARTMMATTLDLLGLTSKSLASASGGLGSSIYAGKIYSNDNLEIAGSANIWSGLQVTNGITADELYLSGLNGTTPAASISGNTQ